MYLMTDDVVKGWLFLIDSFSVFRNSPHMLGSIIQKPAGLGYLAAECLHRLMSRFGSYIAVQTTGSKQMCLFAVSVLDY